MGIFVLVAGALAWSCPEDAPPWAERWLEAATVDEPATASEANERFCVAMGGLGETFARGGVDALLSGPAEGDVRALRARLAALDRLDAAAAPARAGRAARRLALAGELARIAGEEDARGEALVRIAEALVEHAEALERWPRAPGAVAPTPGYEGLAEGILEGALARATRTLSWGPWTHRAEALLLERAGRAPRIERRGVTKEPWPVPFAGPETRLTPAP